MDVKKMSRFAPRKDTLLQSERRQYSERVKLGRVQLSFLAALHRFSSMSIEQARERRSAAQAPTSNG